MGCGSSSTIEAHRANAGNDSIVRIILQKPTIPEMTIYYGTQTGNAKSFAEGLLKEANERYNLKGSVIDLTDFDAKELESKELAVFIVASYGEGGPTDNAQLFYQWVINEYLIEKVALPELRYAVFGCGDSSFVNTFNRMAKITDEKLAARKALKVTETGLGDNSKDLKKDFENWKAKFWLELINYYTKEQNKT